MKEKLTSNISLLIYSLIIFAIAQFIELVNIRPVMYDEAWYANTAYNFFIGNGFYNTAVGSGGNANFLLPLITGCFFHLFGANLFVIRLVPVLCGLSVLVVLHFIMNEFDSSKIARMLTYLVFVSVTLFNTIFRFGRPECLSALCSGVGILFFIRYYKNNSFSNILFLSFFAILSSLAHPASLIVFLIIGVVLLCNVFVSKNWNKIMHLMILLIFAISSVCLIFYISHCYNISENSDGSGILNRFSIKNIFQALPVYLKSCFVSANAISFYLFYVVLFLSLIQKYNRLQHLIAIIGISTLICYPFFFSTDLAMIGLGLDYVSIIAMTLFAPSVDIIKNINYHNSNRVLLIMMLSYCCFNVVVTNLFNFKVKYSKDNEILQSEVIKYIPNDALVFGALRLWPFAIHTQYFSDHYRSVLPKQFEYLLVNSQDEIVYSNYDDVYVNIADYVCVYEYVSKQYGVVKIFKNINLLKNNE